MSRLNFRQEPTIDFRDVEQLSRQEARREAEALREGIAYHDYLYHAKQRPKISDAVYDKLVRRLQDLAKTCPGLAAERPRKGSEDEMPLGELRPSQTHRPDA